MRRVLTAVVIALAMAEPLFADTITGKVVGVTDSDTIIVVDGAKVRRAVCFRGVDAPELPQPFGAEARLRLLRALFGQTVTVRVLDRDEHARIVGDVYFGDRWMNLEMLADGYGWWVDQCNPPPELRQAQDAARAARCGLWRHASPVPPWAYRERGGEDSTEGGYVSGLQTWLAQRTWRLWVTRAAQRGSAVGIIVIVAALWIASGLIRRRCASVPAGSAR